MSYLYIGLLTQLSYLTYVGFLNSSPKRNFVVIKHNETSTNIYRLIDTSWQKTHLLPRVITYLKDTFL